MRGAERAHRDRRAGDPARTVARTRAAAQLASHRASRGGGLDLQPKLRIGEELIAQQAFLRSRALRRKPYRDAVLGERLLDA